MIQRVHQTGERHSTAATYMSGEAQSILMDFGRTVNDPALVRSIRFSSKAILHVRSILETGGTIVTDTMLTAEGIDRSLLDSKKVSIECFFDDPEVSRRAQARGITRAETATEIALARQGAKLLVFGSAPAGLRHVLRCRQLESLDDVCVLAGFTGFAGSIQMKETLIESDIASIVIRGKKGGLPATVSVLNAIIRQIAREMR